MTPLDELDRRTRSQQPRGKEMEECAQQRRSALTTQCTTSQLTNQRFQLICAEAVREAGEANFL